MLAGSEWGHHGIFEEEVDFWIVREWMFSRARADDPNRVHIIRTEETIERNAKSFERITRALRTALRADNTEMIRIWTNHRMAMLRRLRWDMIRNQRTGSEHHTSST